jgi:hypothetical protein
MKITDDTTKSKLYEDLKDVSLKYGEIYDKYDLLKIEYEELKKKFEHLSRTSKKE